MPPRLSKEEREKIIKDYENGIEHPDYMVVKNNLGTCVRRRKNASKKTSTPKEAPRSEDVPVNSVEVKEPEPQPQPQGKDKSWMNDIHYYNLNNTINMMNHNIQELNEKLSKYKTKQTKLKGKYKKLKHAIYDEDEDDEAPIEVGSVSRPVEEAPTEPVEQEEPQATPLSQPQTEEVVEEEVEEEPQQEVYVPVQRSRRCNFRSYF